MEIQVESVPIEQISLDKFANMVRTAWRGGLDNARHFEVRPEVYSRLFSEWYATQRKRGRGPKPHHFFYFHTCVSKRLITVICERRPAKA